MKKSTLLLVCFVLLVGCAKIVVTPPPDEVPTPPVQPDGPTHLVKAIAVVDGQEVELTPHEPTRLIRVYAVVNGREIDLTGNSMNTLAAVEAEVVLEFSNPIDPDSLGDSNFTVADSAGTRLHTQLSPDATSLQLPRAIKDSRGNTVWVRQHLLQFARPAYAITNVCLDKYPEVVLQPWSGVTLSPGEVIRFEFVGAVDQQQVISSMSEAIYVSVRDEAGYHLKETPALTLTWTNDRVLLLTIDEAVNTVVYFSTEELNYQHFSLRWELFMIPPQRLVVLDAQRFVLNEVDLPLSTIGPIAMTTDFSRVRLARLGMWGPMHYGSSEYAFDVTSGRVQFSDSSPGLAHGLQAYALLNVTQRVYEKVTELRLYGDYHGMSNDGTRISSYFSNGEVVVTSLRTGERTHFPVESRMFDPIGSPCYSMFWSPDDRKIIYSGHSDIGEWGTYLLDMATGKETLLAVNQSLYSASPHSEHFLTGGYANNGLDFHLVTYSGKKTRLNEGGGRVVLTKWIDADRAIINKSPSEAYDSLSPDSQCYIYYLNENRWEYVAAGYGFDYDVKTGRMFLLQGKHATRDGSLSHSMRLFLT